MTPTKKVAKPSTSKAVTGAKSPAKTTRTAAGKKKRGATSARANPAVRAAAVKTTATKVSPKRRPTLGKPTTIDEYLSQVDTATRDLLQKLRRTIHELVPDVVECISYSMPAFRYQGKVIAGFLATKAGASYFPFSGTTLGTLRAELEGRSHTKSGLHFTPAEPLPKSLVHTLLRARIAEL